MPIYTYKSISGENYEFLQGINDEPYTRHPETNEVIKKIVSIVHVKHQGLPRYVKVNKKSPAATACGCASHSHSHSHSR